MTFFFSRISMLSMSSKPKKQVLTLSHFSLPDSWLDVELTNSKVLGSLFKERIHNFFHLMSLGNGRGWGHLLPLGFLPFRLKKSQIPNSWHGTVEHFLTVQQLLSSVFLTASRKVVTTHEAAYQQISFRTYTNCAHFFLKHLSMLLLKV